MTGLCVEFYGWDFIMLPKVSVSKFSKSAISPTTRIEECVGNQRGVLNGAAPFFMLVLTGYKLALENPPG